MNLWRRTLVLLLFVLFAGSIASAQEAVPGEYVVSFKPSGAAANQLASELGVETLKRFPRTRARLVRFRNHQAYNSIHKDPRVRYIEPNYIYQASIIPNDSDFGELWGMHNTGQGGGEVDVDINAPEAWDLTTGSTEIVVAVIDSGIDEDHPDLVDNMWSNPGEIPENGIDDDENGFVDDVHGFNFINTTGDSKDDYDHGTHVAGTIGAKGNDAKGVVGVNWTTKLMALKFLDHAGTGTLANALEAIEYAVMMKRRGVNIRVMNNSWGSSGAPSAALKEAIVEANEEGILFVAAAGNQSSDNDTRPVYPANYNVENVVSVTAVSRFGNLASFSNFGSETVHLAGPGRSIFSSIPGGSYAFYSGTSMATPHVAGAAALALSLNLDGDVSPGALRVLLMSTAKELTALDGRLLEPGIVDASALVDVIDEPIQIVKEPDATEKAVGQTAEFRVYAAGTSELSYQWQQDGVDIEGETSYVLMVPASAENHQSSYRCRVSNVSGTLTSSQALLTVLFPPVLTAHPQDISADEGEEVVFSVEAVGSEPLSFQWRRNGVIITGAQLSELRFEASLEDDEAIYSCIVSNDVGSAGSDSAALSINEYPPEPPHGLSAADGESIEQILLAWSGVEGALFYRVYRSEVEGELGVLLADEVAEAQYEDSTAISGLVYYYLISAVNDVGESEFSEPDSGFRAVDPATVDSDSDGVSDAAELEDGTDPMDRGSFRLTLKSPVFAKYNTFLSQQNFLELLAAGTAPVSAVVTVYDEQGEEISQSRVFVPSGEQIDLNINEMLGREGEGDGEGTVGVLRIEYKEEVGVRLLGRLSSYRFNAVSGSYSFAFTRELRNPTRGATFAAGNSYDAQGNALVVPNWAEIINLASSARTFTHNLYSQQGVLLCSSEVTVPPLGERDLEAGHEAGEGVYLNEFIPHDPMAAYLAYVTRYGRQTAGLLRATDSYNYAVSLDALPGSRAHQYGVLSKGSGECWTQSNWLEVVNVGSEAGLADVVFFADNGAVLGRDQIYLEAKSQVHYNAGALLSSGTLGSYQLSPVANQPLIAQSAVYFHDCEANKLQTAYAVSSRVGVAARLSGSFNSFVGIKNRFHLVLAQRPAQFSTEHSVSLSLQQKGESLGEIFYAGLVNGFFKTVDSALDDYVQANTYGTLELSADGEGRFVAENIRLREVDGRADFAMPTALQ